MKGGPGERGNKHDLTWYRREQQLGVLPGSSEMTQEGVPRTLGGSWRAALAQEEQHMLGSCPRYLSSCCCAQVLLSLQVQDAKGPGMWSQRAPAP